MADSKGNSGHYNSGNYNSGHANSGDYNSGHYNSGDYNSGHYNSGDCNSGNYNSGDYNSGYFNTNRPTVRLFNKDTGKESSEIDIPRIDIPTTKWVRADEMTAQQKKDDPEFRVKGGTLINRTYKEAWKIAWHEVSEKVRQQFKDLPNFCPKIFEEITGIDVTVEDEVKIEVEGRTIFLSRKSAIALGLIKE